MAEADTDIELLSRTLDELRDTTSTIIESSSQAEGGGGGGLKRSFSSSNIAKMVDEEGGPGYAGVPVPKFDRKSKPSLISCRNFAGKWGT